MRVENKLTVVKILTLIMLVVFSAGFLFSFTNVINKDGANAYLKNDGTIMGVITIGGLRLQINQNEQDCQTVGIDLGTTTLATDKVYSINSVNITKKDAGQSTCYIRWKFVATIDGVGDIDINNHCLTSDPNVFLDKEQNYFYYVSETYEPISLTGNVCVLDEMYFKGEYDTLSKKYGSIIDEYFSGSNFKLNLIVEVSETPWSINKPYAYFYVNGEVAYEYIDFVNATTIPNVPEANKTTVINGQTLYFECWAKEGGGLFLPGSSVILSEYDVFEAVYSKEEGTYSKTTLAYTANADGTYSISGVNQDSIVDGNLVISNFSEDEQITVIEDGAFQGDKTITSVSASNSSITTIGDYAFYGCSKITSVTLPDTLTEIGDSAFARCYNLESVTVPEGVQTIGHDTFSACRNLEEVTLPDSVTYIDDGAFRNCAKVETLYIGPNVSEIEDTAFVGMSALTTFEVHPDNQYFSTDGPRLYNKDQTILLFYPSASGSYVVPDHVLTLKNWAFYGCTGLTSITLHSKITSIYGTTFGGCVNLTNIIISSSHKYMSAQNGIIYDKDKDTLISWPSATGAVSIPAGVITVRNRALNYNPQITSVVFGNDVTTVSERVLQYCYNLQKITFGANVTKIGSHMAVNAPLSQGIEFTTTTNWYSTTNASYTGGASVSSSVIANATTMASNMNKSSSNAYWYRVV